MLLPSPSLQPRAEALSQDSASKKSAAARRKYKRGPGLQVRHLQKQNNLLPGKGSQVNLVKCLVYINLLVLG